FGVQPLGGSNGLGRLKPGLQAVRGSWSQCAASRSEPGVDVELECRTVGPRTVPVRSASLASQPPDFSPLPLASPMPRTGTVRGPNATAVHGPSFFDSKLLSQPCPETMTRRVSRP